MLITTPSPAQIVLEVLAVGLDGAPKSDVASGTVRVYHLAGGVETPDLVPTPLALAPGSSVWRYVWVAPLVPVGAYVAEFKLVDVDSVVGVTNEDLVVQVSLAQLFVDLEIIRKVESNRWKLDKNTLQMIFYDDDQTTPLLKFNLFDRNGAPNVEEVFERVPTP